MADNACREFRELISAFIDGEATADESARLRQHLAACADCRATLDSYRQVGQSIRSMPSIHPPSHLSDTIFAQTIDAEPRRLFLITSRIGYSIAGVAAVLLIFVVAAYLIVAGYQRGIEPAVASTAPKQEETWPLHEPIRITFNKQMNHESVEAAFGMIPEGERDRLDRSWDGNTLVVGGNVPLKPDSFYAIKISTAATDKWGNPLGAPFELSFRSSSLLSAIQTPTPQPSPTATIDLPRPTDTPTRATPPSTAPQPAQSATPVGATATTRVDPAPGVGSPIGSIDPTATTAPQPTPTDPASDEPVIIPQPTSTPTPTPSPTPTSTATPTIEPQPPTPTATSTATSTPSPTATATPETIPVTGAFGDVYWRDQNVQDRLGEATSYASVIGAQQLEFQHGVMFLNEDTQSIYVLFAGLGWDMYPAPTGEYPVAEPGPESGVFVPGGVFGSLWENEPSVSSLLGYAHSDVASNFSGSIQTFDGGVMLATPSTVYVVYNDGTWDWFTYTAP